MKPVKFILLAIAMLLAAPAFLTSCDKDAPEISTEDYVDLGLSVKWAKCNLGASKPSDYGDYYAWGETEPNKSDCSWATYKWGTKFKLSKYNAADDKATLDPADDAATAKLGSPWRMPTEDEIKELLSKCTWTRTTQDGKGGYEVKGPNGNSIFLPAAGNYVQSELRNAGSWGIYWSGSLNTVDSGSACCFYFGLDEHDCTYDSRCYGLSVRPVCP